MILADVRIEGQKSLQLLKFNDGHMPRIGDTIKLGPQRYKVREVAHKFSRLDLLGAFHNEKYFGDIPAVEILLKRKV